jgi:hypothetical protein
VTVWRRDARNDNGRGCRGPLGRGGEDGGARERGCGRGKEAEATHHLLRYRRRLFLILAGPIWDFWLRHWIIARW